MKMIIIIILITFFIQPISYAQHAVIVSNKYSINYKIHKGYIELSSGEKVNGAFQYADMEFPTYNLKSFNANGTVIKRYKTNTIKLVALKGSDTSLTHNDSTYFKALNKGKVLYRQLTFGSIEIYDYFFNVDERNGLIKPPILVKKDGQLIEFYSEEKFIKWLQTNNSDKIKWHVNITAIDIIRQLNGIN